MKRQFIKEVQTAFEKNPLSATKKLLKKDLQHLPEIVQQYLIKGGHINKEIIQNFRLVFTGKIRSEKDSPWMSFESIQYNFFQHPTRLFYIKASKLGLPVKGFHLFKDNLASMQIKLLGLFSIIDAQGPEMDQSESVTFFNDLCIFAPSQLVDPKIQWKPINEQSVLAKYPIGDFTINAKLIFDDRANLVNFISEDRYEAIPKQGFIQNTWSTPLQDFRLQQGRFIGHKGSAIYHRQAEDFCYLTLQLKEIQFNLNTII